MTYKAILGVISPFGLGGGSVARRRTPMKLVASEVVR
jgi:hypothetical protein